MDVNFQLKTREEQKSLHLGRVVVVSFISAPRAVAAAPQTPQLGGPTLPKGAPNCLEGPKLHQFKNKVLLGESR